MFIIEFEVMIIIVDKVEIEDFVCDVIFVEFDVLDDNL